MSELRVGSICYPTKKSFWEQRKLKVITRNSTEALCMSEGGWFAWIPLSDLRRPTP